MFGEISWIHIDRVVQHYAAASAHVDSLPELGREITQLCSELSHRPPTFADLSNFFSSGQDEQMDIVRSHAWMCQNILGARAWGVGQKILFERKHKRLSSPIIDQLRELGIPTDDPMALEDIAEAWPEDVARHDKLDTLLVDFAKSKIYIVKGQTTTFAKKLCNQFSLIRPVDRATLFGGQRRTVFKSQYARSDAVAAALFAADLVKRMTVGVEVIPLFLTAEDPGGISRFQLTDLRSLDRNSLTSQRVLLDDYSAVSTHEDFTELLDDDPEALYGLPSWKESDYCKKAPVDIPIRSIMLLRTIGEKQRLIDHRLHLMSQRDLAFTVSSQYNITYPQDTSRHDILRLQRAGLLADSPNGSKTVALSTSGLARLMLLEHRFNLMIPRPSGSILQTLTDHELRWVEAQRV